VANSTHKERRVRQTVRPIPSNIVALMIPGGRTRRSFNSYLITFLGSRSAIRHFEEEVQEYLSTLRHSPAIRDEMAGLQWLFLTHVHGTYSRAFDLCKLKLTNISNAHVDGNEHSLKCNGLSCRSCFFIHIPSTLPKRELSTEIVTVIIKPGPFRNSVIYGRHFP